MDWSSLLFFVFLLGMLSGSGYVGSYRYGIASHNWHSFSARAFKFQSVYLFVKTVELISFGAECFSFCSTNVCHR